jgi:hypothetical protein
MRPVVKRRWKNMIPLALCIACFSVSSLDAQTRNDVQYIKKYLSGYEFQITYREGGSQYGTYYFLDVHFCSSGQYLSSSQSRKQTVLGNEQANSWNDSGTWDVVLVQGNPALHYRAASGAQDIVPLQVLPDGSIISLSGAFMQRLGKAQCR